MCICICAYADVFWRDLTITPARLLEALVMHADLQVA